MTASPPLLVVLTGPSGAGKDSVLAELKNRNNSRYAFAVTATTRSRRPGEQHGVDYYFVSPDEFEHMVVSGELLEHAQVYAHQYGVPRAPVRELLDKGLTVLLRTDVQGARYIKRVTHGALTIFISAPSEEELERRLRARGGDSPDQVELRTRTAKIEMQEAGEFDHVVVNDDLETCVAEVERIIERELARADRVPLEIP